MGMIENDCLEPLNPEFRKPYYAEFFQFVKEEYAARKVFPPADDIFNAFHLTPLSQVKVVILGQDPYHNDGQAHGLCFSVKPDVDIPPSLVNIYQELHDDLGCDIPNNGYLTKWAEQGVFPYTTLFRSIRPIPIEERAGRNLRMQPSASSMSRIGPSCLFCGEVRPRKRRRCCITRSILF